MIKFKSEQLAKLKIGKRELDKLYKQLLKNFPITLKIWNEKNNSAVLNNFKYQLDDLQRMCKIIENEFSQLKVQYSKNQFGTTKTTTLSGRGWSKDHNNYNKREKWELPPSLRRTPARNVTKTGAKRKRKTTIKRYK